MSRTPTGYRERFIEGNLRRHCASSNLCGLNNTRVGVNRIPFLFESYGSSSKYGNRFVLGHYIIVCKTQCYSNVDVGFHSSNYVCHTLCQHVLMPKVSHLATHCEDSSNAKHRAFPNAKSAGYVQSLDHKPAVCVDAFRKQIYEVCYCIYSVQHYHCNPCNVDFYMAHSTENLKATSTDISSIGNIHQAMVTVLAGTGELDAEEHAPQESARDHVRTSDNKKWEVLSSYDIIDVLRRLIEPPSIDDLICMLQICRRKKDLKYGKHLHTHMCKFGLETHKIIGNHLVQMYADCGCVSMAQQVLSLLVNHNVFTWTSLMSGFIQCGQGHQVVTMYEKMHEIRLYPTKHTLVTLLKACARLKDLERGKQIYSCILQRGFETDLFVGSTLIDMYAKCDLLLDAEEVFDKLSFQNTVSWTALIAAYTEHKYVQKALNCFEQMQCEGNSPDEVTFVLVLKCCGILKAHDKALETHFDIILKGFEKGLLTGNSIVDMYAKCGLLAEASEVCSQLAVRDVVSWTALITGYSELGRHEELLLCFDKMQLEGILPDAMTFASVLKACSSIGAIGKGQKIHEKAKERQLDCEMFVCSTLVDMYAKCGFLSEAQEAFDKLPIRDAVSWNALMAGYAEHGPCKEALRHFERMQSDGVAPGSVSFLCALKACGDSGSMFKGQELHTDCTLRAFDDDLSIGSTLVDMYAKLGLLLEAQDVFQTLQARDVVLWNAIIKAHSINQVGGMAIHLFECMQVQGVRPDSVTFTCLLKACSRTCLVQKGQQLFNIMTKDYGIVTTRDHVIGMVDLFSRSGHVEAAWKSLKTMPASPSDEMLRVLLSACKTHSEQALGVLCFEQLFQLNPECAASYLLMSNIYQRQGEWELAYRLEQLRQYTMAKKKPASALIEVNKTVYEFVVGKPRGKELSQFLGALTFRTVSCGHVPDLEGILRCRAASYDFAP